MKMDSSDTESCLSGAEQTTIDLRQWFKIFIPSDKDAWFLLSAGQLGDFFFFTFKNRIITFNDKVLLEFQWKAVFVMYIYQHHNVKKHA